jgi:uncharacterized protein Yka (UPF0111/DUF47 family)
MKKLLVIAIGVIAILIVLSFVKDIVIKTSVEKGVEVVTGLRLNIRNLNVGIIRTLVGIKGLKLHNPSGFRDRTMLDMPEIYVDYNLPSIMKGKVHLNEMRINMKEFSVVKNEKGQLNLDSLKVVQAQKEGTRPEEKETQVPEMQIDDLELKIGKVVYKDYSRGGEPLVKEFNLNINERYQNIKDPYSLVSLIVVKALMNTTIARLADFDLQGLKGTISDTLATAQKVAAETAAKAEETIRQTTEETQKAAQEISRKTQETTEQATESIKKATEDLQKTFKLPFGSGE